MRSTTAGIPGSTIPFDFLLAIHFTYYDRSRLIIIYFLRFTHKRNMLSKLFIFSWWNSKNHDSILLVLQESVIFSDIDLFEDRMSNL